ncbi:MAG: hypothetical protein HY664_07990 [Chloroflexi bacterium]|nr:hypothetical protein [Chloroflexota bacterium]
MVRGEPLKDMVRKHPQIVAWVALAIGMVTLLLLAARGVDLKTSQLTALVAATIGLAGLCVWIIGWDKD